MKINIHGVTGVRVKSYMLDRGAVGITELTILSERNGETRIVLFGGDEPPAITTLERESHDGF